MGKVEAGVAIGLVLLALVGYAAAKRAGVLPGANSFNPLSPDNLAYRGANAVLQSITGNPVDTVGTVLASGYSNQVGNDAVTPVQIVNGHAVPPPAPFNPISDLMPFLGVGA